MYYTDRLYDVSPYLWTNLLMLVMFTTLTGIASVGYFLNYKRSKKQPTNQPVENSNSRSEIEEREQTQTPDEKWKKEAIEKYEEITGVPFERNIPEEIPVAEENEQELPKIPTRAELKGRNLIRLNDAAMNSIIKDMKEGIIHLVPCKDTETPRLFRDNGLVGFKAIVTEKEKVPKTSEDEELVPEEFRKEDE